MTQHVLTVAGAVLHSAEVADKLMMQSVYADFEHSRFASFADCLIDFLARLLDHFLDARGMDASVHDQLFETDARDLSAHRIERGQDDRFRRIVDDEVDAGRRFERTDVASFTTDDTTLHFIVGQRHDGHGRFRNVIRGATLNRQRDDVSCALVGFFLGALLNFSEHDRRFVLGFLLCTGKHHGLCLVEGDAGDAFQLLLLLRIQSIDLFFDLIKLLGAVVQLLLTALDAFELFIQRFFALEQSAFVLLDFVSAFSDFFFCFVPDLVGFVLCFKDLFLADLFGFLLGFVIQALHGVLGLFDLRLSDIFTIEVADCNSDRSAENQSDADQNILPPQHDTLSPIYMNITEQTARLFSRVDSSFRNSSTRKKHAAKRSVNLSSNTMMNALGSAGLLNNIVNVFSCKVKNRVA